MGNLEALFDLTCMSLDCVRKQEHPEETHTGTKEHANKSHCIFFCSVLLYMH